MTGKPEQTPNGPVILDLETTPLPDAPSPSEAPPIPEPGGEAAAQALHLAARRGGGAGGVFLGLLGGLIALFIGVGIHDFLTGLFERNLVLGSIGLALAGALAVFLAGMALREVAALARLGRIETLQEQAMNGDARRLLPGLKRLYSARPELEAATREVAAAQGDTPDNETLIATAERAYLSPLDRAAEQVVARASRDVAAATALIPLALVDVLAVLWANLRMIRGIAEIYGGRAGWLGSWRLLRAVAAHLIATGAIAATDDLLGPLVGGGVLGKLSRRFGEAAVNAALTARVGVAAIEVCRPMPFSARSRPRASSLVFDALKGWRRDPD